jgi:hypothetical protein
MHYFEPGTYQTDELDDTGNKTLWINPWGLDSNNAGFIFASYGSNRYFTIQPDGNFGLRLFTDTDILRTEQLILGNTYEKT